MVLPCCSATKAMPCRNKQGYSAYPALPALCHGPRVCDILCSTKSRKSRPQRVSRPADDFATVMPAPTALEERRDPKPDDADVAMKDRAPLPFRRVGELGPGAETSLALTSRDIGLEPGRLSAMSC